MTTNTKENEIKENMTFGNWIVEKINEHHLIISNTTDEIKKKQKIQLAKTSNGWFDRIDYKGITTTIYPLGIYMDGLIE